MINPSAVLGKVGGEIEHRPGNLIYFLAASRPEKRGGSCVSGKDATSDHQLDVGFVAMVR